MLLETTQSRRAFLQAWRLISVDWVAAVTETDAGIEGRAISSPEYIY